MISHVMNGTELLAIIVSGRIPEPGIHFVTPHRFSQQLAYLNLPSGKSIEPHIHNPVNRTVSFTQEVLHIKKGKLRVDFYDEAERYLESRILDSGDTILLAAGGHGFHVLEDVEMIEVKQGPYDEKRDKRRFPGISPDEVVVRDGR
jgi:hypothetical protein